MRKLWVLVVIIFLAGCVTIRTYEIEKPRVDTEIQGNQGYISGTAKEAPKKSRLGDTRKISVVEIDFGPAKPKEEKEEAVSEEVIAEEESYVEEAESVEDISLEMQEPAPQQVYQSYIVQKDDTLQKISFKFYGTTRKWKKIYEANKDIIKNPDRVYPGTEIKIPVSQ